MKAAIKQVRFTEVCASDVDPTTLADDGAPIHEASMVLHSPGLSLDQALHANIYGTSHPVMLSDARNLSKDKMLVGALDSACNRTCTGPKWLEAYTARLRESAPPFVTELIQEITEHENFRFGNGGVVPSTHRWRIPAFVGGRVLLIWVSLVPVPSLGLLLGRDFLESVGGVLDFADKTISFKHLEAETQRLEQMSAGHYMLPLLAELWPRLPVLRWKRCGLDGIIELQMSSKDWLHRCLTDKQNELKTTSKQVSDHFLIEHFNEYVFSGPPAQSKTADVPMSSSAFQTHIVASFCGESLRSPNSVTAMAVGSPGCERDNQAPDACGSKDVLRGDRVLRPNLVPLEKIHPSRPRASSLARTKFAFVVAIALAATFCAFSIPFHRNSKAMGGTGSCSMSSWNPHWLSSANGLGQEEIQCPELASLEPVSQSLRMEAGIPRRSSFGWLVGRSITPRPSKQTEASFHDRVEEASCRRCSKDWPCCGHSSID